MDDLVPSLKSNLPQLRGRLLASEPLAPLTWFRVGGPAQVLFMPEDENDLAYLLGHLPPDIPVTAIGLGSNLIVRELETLCRAQLHQFVEESFVHGGHRGD